MFTPLDEYDARDVVLAAQSMTERRRAIELEDLQLVARWADLHGADPMAGPGGRRRWDDGGDRRSAARTLRWSRSCACASWRWPGRCTRCGCARWWPTCSTCATGSR